MKNALFFGDSLTAGYGMGDAATESFPALIQQKINAEKLEYNDINGGLSGDTSAGGLRRIDYWLSNPVSVFILELGINDMMRRVSPQTTLTNLQAIINKVKQTHPQAKIALMGMELPALIPGKAAQQFGKHFRDLANFNQLTLVPFFLEGVAGRAHLNLPDRIHPSADGYKIIANHVWPVIRELFTS
ncbi:MAG: arylesterase [Bacteroidota bacterium]|nr:arylesterase [Bacteroidota bacterium]